MPNNAYDQELMDQTERALSGQVTGNDLVDDLATTRTQVDLGFQQQLKKRLVSQLETQSLESHTKLSADSIGECDSQNPNRPREKEAKMSMKVLPLPRGQKRPLQGLFVTAIAAMVVIVFSIVFLGNLLGHTRNFATMFPDKTILFEQYLEVIWNEGNLDMLGLFVTNDPIHHDVSLVEDFTGIEAVTQYITTNRMLLPDLVLKVNHLTPDGDRISGELTASANDKTVTVFVESRFANDKIAEVWFDASVVLAALTTQETEKLPLTVRGSYHGGARNLTFVDEQRDGRKVQVYLMYPAIVPEDQQEKLLKAEQSHFPIKDLVPDMSGAPYPVVLNSHWYQGNMGDLNMILEPLVSRGFVVASLTHPDSTSALTYIDRPLDILFVIDQLAALNEAAGSDLAGLMDMDQIGVIGSDDGGDAALMVSGARVDPEAASQYTGWYGIEDLRDWYPDWDWTAMAAYHDQLVPTEADDPLWPAMTDPRIRAVVAYMPSEAVDLLGERGLATATTPALVIGGTEGIYDWYASAFTNLGSDERYLLTLVGADHDNLFSLPDQTRLVVQQFVTAFFAYYLQGKSDYAEYLTEYYAKSLDLDNVIWGIDESALLAPWNIAEMTFSEGGTVAVDDTIAGEVAEPGARIGYRLTLDTETILNLYVNSVPKYQFDSVLYVCDAERDVLFWNDELGIDDYTHDAGLKGIELSPGSYILIVRGWGHSTGSYELVVERAE